MSILVIGLSHRTAPVSLLERVALSPDASAKLLSDIVASEHAVEALVLSTCNRAELYSEVEKFHGGVSAATELLARHAGVSPEALTPHLYVHYEDRAVAHFFAVACGLDSMVVGESQILGQVKVALRQAQEAGTAGRTLGGLAQQALRVGKRARTETGIDRAGRSLVSAGLDAAERVLGPIGGRTTLVVGAGSMSALAASVLTQRGSGEVIVANRTLPHANRVAATVGGRAVHLEVVADVLPHTDVVISCTGAIGHVLPLDLIASAQLARGNRPLLIVDLALPRDVDPRVRGLPGVTLVDLESLAATLADDQRHSDIDQTRAIVADEVSNFVGRQHALAVTPSVVALRSMADAVVSQELNRLSGRLPDLDGSSWAEVEQAVRRVVDKVLHAPTVRVKQLPDEPGGPSYAEALNKLFGLDPKATEALTRADIAEVGDEPPGEP
jgi:glutamyl-tRNA reductase